MFTIGLDNEFLSSLFLFEENSMTGCRINFHSSFVISELKLLTTLKSGK